LNPPPIPLQADCYKRIFLIFAAKRNASLTITVGWRLP
jgi:hypothetical protein